MDVFGDILRVIKLVLVLIGTLLLAVYNQTIQNTIRHRAAFTTFIIVSWILIPIQIPMLLLGIMFSGVSMSPSDSVHKEKTFDNRTIYAYTADPGAMGRAYHHFYLKCPRALDRYELVKIAKLNWMGSFEFAVTNNELTVDAENGTSHQFDISQLTCI